MPKEIKINILKTQDDYDQIIEDYFKRVEITPKHFYQDFGFIQGKLTAKEDREILGSLLGTALVAGVAFGKQNQKKIKLTIEETNDPDTRSYVG